MMSAATVSGRISPTAAAANKKVCAFNFSASLRARCNTKRVSVARYELSPESVDAVSRHRANYARRVSLRSPCITTLDRVSAHKFTFVTLKALDDHCRTSLARSRSSTERVCVSFHARELEKHTHVARDHDVCVLIVSRASEKRSGKRSGLAYIGSLKRIIKRARPTNEKTSRLPRYESQ